MQTMTLCIRRIFHRAELRRRADVDAHLHQRGAGVLQQQLLEGRIGPGARHHLGAKGRRAAVHQVDAGRDLLRRQYALLDQQRAHRLLQDLVGTGGSGVVILARRVGIAMIVAVVIMVVIVVVMIVVVLVVVHLSPLLLQRLQPIVEDVGFELVAAGPS